MKLKIMPQRTIPHPTKMGPKDKILFLANDHAGLLLRESIISTAHALDFKVVDFGTPYETSVDYPDFAEKLIQALKTTDGYGVLICGTGIGMSIAANRHPHIRAALCHTAFEADVARQHNNANVLCLGGRTLSPAAAMEILMMFLSTNFEGGRHQRRLQKLDTIKC